MSLPDEDFWESLRLRPKVSPQVSPAQRLLQWASEFEPSPVVVLKGPPSKRAEAYAWLRQRQVPLMGRDGWLGVGVFEDFAFHVSRIGGDWNLLWSLCDVEDFVVDEPLRSMIDRGTQYTELFQAIWEIRFLLDEGLDVRPHVEAFTHWLTEGEDSELLRGVGICSRLLSVHQRIDLLLFLLALAQQNSLIDAPIFVFDGLERATAQEAPVKDLLQGLVEIVEAVESWASLGSPAGILVGVSPGGVLKSLRKYNPKLIRLLGS
jgi:hypothetical protein